MVPVLGGVVIPDEGSDGGCELYCLLSAVWWYLVYVRLDAGLLPRSGILARRCGACFCLTKTASILWCAISPDE